MTKDEALKLALEALEWEEAQTSYPSRMMTNAITAIKAALANEALERKAENAKELGLDYEPCCYGGIAHDCHAGKGCQIAERLKTSAKVKDEPVAVIDSTISGHIDWLCTFFPKQGTPLYTAPPQRKPLTDEELSKLEGTYIGRRLARAIEAAHGIKEKNT